MGQRNVIFLESVENYSSEKYSSVVPRLINAENNGGLVNCKFSLLNNDVSCAAVHAGVKLQRLKDCTWLSIVIDDIACHLTDRAFARSSCRAEQDRLVSFGSSATKQAIASRLVKRADNERQTEHGRIKKTNEPEGLSLLDAAANLCSTRAWRTRAQPRSATLSEQIPSPICILMDLNWNLLDTTSR